MGCQFGPEPRLVILSTNSGNAYENRNCDMGYATMEGRDELGRTTSGPDTKTRGKTRRHNEGGTYITKVDSTKSETVYACGSVKQRIHRE